MGRQSAFPEEPRRLRGDSFTAYLRVVQQETTHIQVTQHRGTPPEQAEQRILSALQQAGQPLSLPDLLQQTALDLRTFTTALEALRDKGKVHLAPDQSTGLEIVALDTPQQPPEA